MTQLPMRDGLVLAGVLFSLGLTGLLVRRNLIFVLMSLEVLLNSAGLAFVVAGSRWHQRDGQIMFVISPWPLQRSQSDWRWSLRIYHRFTSLMWTPSVK
jgi:hypothetical protein